MHVDGIPTREGPSKYPKSISIGKTGSAHNAMTGVVRTMLFVEFGV
jgi:hypothetical protein